VFIFNFFFLETSFGASPPYPFTI